MSAESRIEPSEKIAILAGGKTFPLKIARACKDPLVIGLKGQTDSNLYKEFTYHEVALGQIGKLLDLLKEHDVKLLCMIGKVERPQLSDVKLDLKGAQIAAKFGLDAALGKLGDDGLLRAVKNVLVSAGVRVIGAHQLDPDVLLSKGTLSSLKPSKQDFIDIERGIEVAKAIGGVDVGQAVIVENGVVLGVEAVEGTDALIERCAPLKKKKKERAGVLVKVIKPNQDPDLDMPTIGLGTLEKLYAAGFKGVAAISGKTLFAERDEALAYANKKKLYVHGMVDKS